MQDKHLQRLAALLRHAIRLPPLRHAIRQLPPLTIPRLTLRFHQQKQAAPEPSLPLAPRRRLATRLLPLPATPVAIRVAFPPLLVVELVVALAVALVAKQLLAAEPAPPAVVSAAMDIAEMVFAVVAAAGKVSSGKCSRELAGLAT